MTKFIKQYFMVNSIKGFGEVKKDSKSIYTFESRSHNTATLIYSYQNKTKTTNVFSLH